MSCVTNFAGGIALARGLRVRHSARSTRVGARAESRASPLIACRLSVSRASGAGPTVSVPRVGSARPARAFVVRAADADAAPEPAAPAPAPAPPAKKKRPFIPALDSTRFFLISYIAVGHFIACCTKDAFALKLLSQVNVVVGAFFVLSGYVVAYTCTELGEYKASPRIKPAPQFVASRIMGFYPLYLLAQLAFGWVFVYADNLYNGPIATAWHALITFTLTQAWFPAHAELWNAPTWFLSALAFATAALPFALPSVASWRKRGLKTAMVVLTAVSLIAKIAYSYDTAGWFFMEGVMGPKTHPNWLLFNANRFSPFMALVEILIGCVACRMIMVKECDPAEDPEGAKDASAGILLGGAPGTLAASPAIPLVGMLAVIFARAVGWLSLNDPLTRGALFIPLFTAFVMRVHQQTVYSDLPKADVPGHRSFSTMLGAKWLTYLGAISFPIYILHGPIGQVFYKRAVASKLFNGTVMTKYPEFFPVYLVIVLVCAVATHELFMKNKDAQGWFQKKGQALAERF